jgi:hypothetical protein
LPTCSPTWSRACARRRSSSTSRQIKDPVRDKLKRFDLLDRIGKENFHPTIGSAVDAYLADHDVDFEP